MKDFIGKTDLNTQEHHSGLMDRSALIKELLSETENGSVTSDERYGKIYTVEEGRVYTAYLRIMSAIQNLEITDNSFAALHISRTSANIKRIAVYFLTPERRSIKCIDCIYLETASLRCFELEYLSGTARLECKNTPIRIKLPDDAMEVVGNKVILPITSINADDSDNPGLEFTYLSFQVKVVFDNSLTTE